MFHRLCVFVLTAAVICLLLTTALYTSQSTFLRSLSVSDLLTSTATTQNQDQHSENNSTIVALPPLAAVRPNTTNTEKMTIVLATMQSTDNSWLYEELGDLLEPQGDIRAAIYVANDHSAPLHTPANKGNEAMSYLTYMIDFYDTLPEISVFLHGHPTAWHNNELLDMSSSSLIRHLNRDKVYRDGYMNLRCHWNPGCPDHLNPFATEYDDEKAEELLIKDAWQEVFEVGEEEVPQSLAQPCCSQFAATRDRIRNLPKAKYEHFRNWLLASNLNDYYTGRMFEYFWQFILNNTPVLCPDPRVCYCDGYGVCFEDPGEYDEYFELRNEMYVYKKQLLAWYDWEDDKEVERDEGSAQEPAAITEAEEAKMDRGTWLEMEIDDIKNELEVRKQDALAVGSDPEKRAAAIDAALMQGEPPLHARNAKVR